MVEIDGKQLRVALIGASCIGKTCIIKRFAENTFHGSQYVPTPGVEFLSRRLTIKPIGTVTLIILDVAGAALTSKMIDIYFHGIDIFLLTYDMTNATSLQELRRWMEILAKNGVDKSEASIALVGSKGDLEHLRTVRLDNHSRFAQEFNIPLSFLVSAKSGESVLTCFSKCAIYHLNPEAKQRVKEHAVLQSTNASKKATTPAQNHPQAMTNPLPTRSQPAPDPNSTVCSVQ
ncbi:unnamed protein product [Allacma fusca]|uniref:Uncharacterized protein n=1 Tax=Allacma fusca TaxID=39272 RepID=A0A8J2KV41_9HEXA|nr:unnamed protein product [Allacma fusca]